MDRLIDSVASMHLVPVAVMLGLMPSRPRFVADVMVGKLARWLRILGYDVAYSNRYEDDEILRLSQEEKRIILTRDLGLLRRCQPPDCLLIEHDALDQQMRQLVHDLGLTPVGLFTRCLECNRPLEDTTKAAVDGRVPPYVYQTQDRFRSCPECGRIYWPGTHGDRVRNRVDEWFGRS